LRDDSSSSLFRALGSGSLRTHPSELIARHAGEWLRSSAAARSGDRRWFELSLSICNESPADSTLRRLSIFTQRLETDPSFTREGPRNALLNPSFEYR
jgi:hypothetical protein